MNTTRIVRHDVRTASADDGAATQASDETALRQRARKLIENGTLPDRAPDRTWGGPGAGLACAICGTPVTPDEIEYEVEFAATEGGSLRHHVHVRCFVTWEVELEQLSRAAEPMSTGGRRRARQAMSRELSD